MLHRVSDMGQDRATQVIHASVGLFDFHRKCPKQHPAVALKACLSHRPFALLSRVLEMTKRSALRLKNRRTIFSGVLVNSFHISIEDPFRFSAHWNRTMWKCRDRNDFGLPVVWKSHTSKHEIFVMFLYFCILTAAAGPQSASAAPAAAGRSSQKINFRNCISHSRWSTFAFAFKSLSHLLSSILLIK